MLQKICNIMNKYTEGSETITSHQSGFNIRTRARCPELVAKNWANDALSMRDMKEL
jgi:hypothetical protein